MLQEKRGWRGTSAEWYTPAYITDALGPFDLDPCASGKREIAKKNYVKKDDGLSKRWKGVCWLNPPYGDATKIWLEKLSKHNNGIALVFARLETIMFFDFVWPKATGIFVFKGRLQFVNGNGGSENSSPAPAILISYGAECLERLRNCGLQGKFIEIK